MLSGRGQAQFYITVLIKQEDLLLRSKGLPLDCPEEFESSRDNHILFALYKDNQTMIFS
jgi:hypothetical protein